MESTEATKNTVILSKAMVNFSGGRVKSKNEWPRSTCNFALDLIQLRSQSNASEKDLKDKRKEFSERMEACSLKRLQLIQNRKEFMERVTNFKPILEDSRIRRFKALQSVKTEKREITFRDEEMSELQGAIKKNKAEVLMMQEIVSSYKPLLMLFDAIKDQCPSGYLDDNVPVYEAVRRRYVSLEQTNRDLKEKSNTTINLIAKLRTEKIEQKAAHENLVMKLTSEMANTQAYLDKLVQLNITREISLESKMLQQQRKHQTLSTILTTIENIGRFCNDPTLPHPKPTSRKTMLDIKLKQIQEFLLQNTLVADYAIKQMSKSS